MNVISIRYKYENDLEGVIESHLEDINKALTELNKEINLTSKYIELDIYNCLLLHDILCELLGKSSYTYDILNINKKCC